jgi:hypothetical protein
MNKLIQKFKDSSSKYPLYAQFWFVGLIITFVYINLSLDYTLKDLYITRIMGLFVPFGIWNSVYAFTSLSALLSIPLMIFSILFADRIATRLNIKSVVIKLIFNLVLLFIITFLVDFLIWHKWLSIGLFLDRDI